MIEISIAAAAAGAAVVVAAAYATARASGRGGGFAVAGRRPWRPNRIHERPMNCGRQHKLVAVVEANRRAKVLERRLLLKKLLQVIREASV